MGVVAEARRAGFLFLDGAAIAILITSIVVSLMIPSRTAVVGRERTDAQMVTQGTFVGPSFIEPVCVDENGETAGCYRAVTGILDRRIPLRAAVVGLGLALALAIAGSTRLAASRSGRGAAR